MSFAVSPAASADVISISADYDRQPVQYGAAFEAEVDDAFLRITANPRLYSPVEDAPPGGEFREYFIARFQQRVIYRVSGEDVLVVAVIHAARRPGAWRRNLPPETA